MTGRLEKRKKTCYTTDEALHYILSADEDSDIAHLLDADAENTPEIAVVEEIPR